MAQHPALLQPLTRCINERDLQSLAVAFAETFHGLARSSPEHFLATPVTAVPTGEERGNFLAIDVGGTNLRVAFVELLGNHDSSLPRNDRPEDLPKIRRSYEKAWPIEDHLKMDQAEDLFAWIGDCIAGVITDALPARDLGDEIPLGITFSFPMTQTSISEATLMPMGKGFGITSDLNLRKMLLAGYARHCSPITSNGVLHPGEAKGLPNGHSGPLPKLRIAAITNDTVATYASLAYSAKASKKSRVAMGLVVGTGTNATIPMTASALSASKREFLSSLGGADLQGMNVVVNTEWSVRGTDAPLKQLGIPTVWDAELDRACEAPGFQPVEYMTAGRYIGELVRLVFVHHLSSQGVVGNLPPALLQKNSITTKFLATSVSLSDDVLLKELIALFPSPSTGKEFSWTMDKASTLRAIAEAVQTRSAALIAAMIVGLLACAGEVQLDGYGGASPKGRSEPAVAEDLIVAYTGGVILQYPGYLQTCENWINTLIKNGSSRATKRVVLGEAKDGGVIGAAVLAGMFSSLR
ncbi:uncharacterized protein K452DRAFT_357315 [Aplosporella prunicola CBS 121167]|uniref:Phosphotransferase n=1 Tax=Aplosporella prunicola CBS 121167 TaxID=1176127 RepID=A0A6A6BMA1_9PEZI|nr:uncharacterized protein K452DRAFT_357315 [Aplosporella prunicola CBS 121167]KAF2143671.1 hypothetical protein K452DRAFT_357315 [Aplosporella prunicola CBS 121167]